MVVKTISKWSIWLGLIGMSSLLAPPVLADLSDGLVAHYPFDGNAHDVSVNGNHINVYGPVLTVDRTGNVDSAYSFDGIDDFMSAGPIMKELVDFSISVWIKTEQIAASFTLHHDPAIIGTLQGLEDSNDFVLATHNGRLSWYNELGTSSGDAGKYVSDNVWHHVVVVRTNSSVTFHVDGIQTDSFSGGSDAVNSNDIEIGRAYWEGVMYFNGSIDDIYIYNRALTQPDIQQLYQIDNQTLPSDNYTLADLEKARNEGKEEGKKACQVNPASCGIDIGSEVAAVIGQDLSLHVFKAQYNTLTGSQILWVDLIFGGENEAGDLTWILSKYGEVE